MFLTIEVVGQSLILLGSAFQESEIYPCSQGFSLTMLSLARTLLPVAVCFQTKDNCPAHRGLKGHRGLQGPEVNMQLRPGTERGAVGLTCVPKAKDTQKQHENFPVSFLTECQLPSATDLPLLLRPGALCFGGLATPPTFL